MSPAGSHKEQSLQKWSLCGSVSQGHKKLCFTVPELKKHITDHSLARRNSYKT